MFFFQYSSLLSGQRARGKSCSNVIETSLKLRYNSDRPGGQQSGDASYPVPDGGMGSIARICMCPIPSWLCIAMDREESCRRAFFLFCPSEVKPLLPAWSCILTFPLVQESNLIVVFLVPGQFCPSIYSQVCTKPESLNRFGMCLYTRL